MSATATQSPIAHRPRLLSDNGSSYISADLAAWLDGKGMQHVRGAPYHRRIQGKIERWHQTLKNRILPESACIGAPIKALSQQTCNASDAATEGTPKEVTTEQGKRLSLGAHLSRGCHPPTLPPRLLRIPPMPVC